MIDVDSSLCTACEQCVSACPSCIMQLNSENVAACVNDKACINCAHCFAICPEGAISINGANPQAMPAVAKINFSQEDRDTLFKTRRSTRVFKKELVPHDLIMQALGDASYAPTAANMQKVEWILIENPSIIQQLTKEVAEFVRAQNIPAFAGYLKIYDAGGDPFLRGAKQVILAHTPIQWDWGPQDAAISISYLELSLHSRNIGTCWSGFVKRASQAGKTPSIELPDDSIIHGGLMFGYAGLQYARIPVRKEIRITIK